MDPVWWLAIGLVVASGLLGTGYFAGIASKADDLRLQEERNAALLRQLKASLAQGTAGATAAQIIVDAALGVALAADAADPDDQFGLLLDEPSDGPAGADSAGGEA